MKWIVGTVPLLALLAGCGSQEAPIAEVRENFKPAVTLNHMMVGVVDHNAHLLWNAAVDEFAPQSEADWHELQHAAVTLASAGNAILLGGSAPGDAEWAQKPDWPALTQRQTDAALALFQAVEKRDRAALSKGGDELTAACEACHTAYKVNTPSIVAGPSEQPEHYYGRPVPKVAEKGR